jgi:hypothetical protein
MTWSPFRPDDECGLAKAAESFGGAAQRVFVGEDGSHPNAFGSRRSGRTRIC